MTTDEANAVLFGEVQDAMGKLKRYVPDQNFNEVIINLHGVLAWYCHVRQVDPDYIHQGAVNYMQQLIRSYGE